MSAARVISLTVIVFFMAILGMLWTALDKVTAIQETAKAPAEVPKRFCKRLDISDDLEMLGYSGCRIEMDLRGIRLQPGEKLLLAWGYETLKGAQASPGIRDARPSSMRGTGGEIARGGDDRSQPGKVELTIIYRTRTGSHPSMNLFAGTRRVRINGQTATLGEFTAEVRGGSAEFIPFRFKEFPLNTPFTVLEYAFAPTGNDGQKIIEDQVTLRWLAEISIASTTTHL